MADEEREENVGQEVENQEVGDQLAQIEALTEMFPDLASDEDVQNLVNVVSNNASTDTDGSEVVEEEVEEEIDDEEEEEEEEVEEEDDEDYEEEEEEEEDDPEDIFGFNKGKKKSVEVDFEFSDEVKEYLKSKYSIDDESKFFNSVNKWRGDAQKFSEVQSNYEELQEGLQGLPDQIKSAISAFANGENFMEAFNSEGSLDFSKEFDKQDEDDVVKYYYPDKYKAIIEKLDDGDLTDEEADDRIKDLADAASQVYKRDKKSVENKRAEMIRQEQVRVKQVKETATSSVDFLKETFPNFKSGDLQRYKKILVDGSLDNHFYDKDGSVKKDAALKLAVAEHWEKILERAKGAAKNQGRSEANMEVVNRGNKKLKKTKSTSAVQKERKAEDAISHLEVHMQNDPYAG